MWLHGPQSSLFAKMIRGWKREPRRAFLGKYGLYPGFRLDRHLDVELDITRAIKAHLIRTRRRHVFHAFRYPMRTILAPVYVGFGLTDLIYVPDLAWRWIPMRLLFLAWTLLAFRLLTFRAIRRHCSSHLAIATIVIAASFLDVP